MDKIIERPVYIEKIKAFLDKGLIKVIVGQRRVGKSFIMKQLWDVILKKKPSANIVYIDKERNEFDFIRDYQVLYDFAKGKHKKDTANYLLIDEIQEIGEFEKALRSLLNEGGFDIYCTGSNADMLSGELATLLSGRYIEIRVGPLSYLEFLHFHMLKNDNRSLMAYMKYGGLPFLMHLELEEKLVYDYLKNIYSTILFKDVVKRYGIRNIAFLESLVFFNWGNIGSLIYAKKISDFLKSQKVNISPRVTLNYLSYLNKAFLVNKAGRYGITGKKVFETGEKHFFEDIGIRNALYGFHQADIGKIMENVVYNHMISCGYQVSVGQIGNYEIDFVCQKQNETMYVQVAYLIANEKTAEREYGNLLKIKDNYPKYVVTMDEFQGNTYQGIQHLHLRGFLSRGW